MKNLTNSLTKLSLGLGAFLLLGLSSCRKDEDFVPSTTHQTGQATELQEVGGFYLLNEGNMGRNKASLDYYDYAKGIYHLNIFPERNPSVVKELGDVGNDIQVYGSRLWAVINLSNLVEVMDATTAKHLGAVPIPNCRYLAFHGRYAYVSSYAGEVKLNDPNARLGYVAKVDTATLQVVATCEVGYQPEEMAIVGNKLYVANSGGYRAPNYDNTISVIDLTTFTEERKIPVAINLHHLLADTSGKLWVSSRGDYGATPSTLSCVDPLSGRVDSTYQIAVTGMTRYKDRLYLYSQPYGAPRATYSILDLKTRQLLPEPFLPDSEAAKIGTAYALAVNPETGEILVTDAGNYVSPGRIYAFSPEGTLRWSAVTGEIPGHIAFLPKGLAPTDLVERIDPPKPGASPYVTKVLAYRPGIGQFVNELPKYVEGDTEETMQAKALQAIGGKQGDLLTLGGWGGYVTVGFDHTIENKAGLLDFRVLGNAFGSTASEPGVIYVAYDRNRNGRPDEGEWYEIAGQAHYDLGSIAWLAEQRTRGMDVALYRDYTITYERPQSEGTAGKDLQNYIRWTDNKGGSGYIAKNSFHAQSYYPSWLKGDSYTLRGTRLPQNGYNTKTDGSSLFHLLAFAYGYADNLPNTEDASAIDIDWAVDASGKPVHLPGVDFIRIQTGVRQENGWLGESSTEVTGVVDLHLEGIRIEARKF